MTWRSANEETSEIKACSREPTKYSAVCSKHILDEDYLVLFFGLTTVDFQRRLQKDNTGILIQATGISIETKQSERKVRKYA